MHFLTHYEDRFFSHHLTDVIKDTAVGCEDRRHQLYYYDPGYEVGQVAQGLNGLLNRSAFTSFNRSARMIGAGKQTTNFRLVITRVFLMVIQNSGDVTNFLKCLSPAHSLPKIPRSNR